MTGVTLAVVTVSFGVTGYSLPWDQVGFWACKIVTGVPAAVPVVGPPIVLLLRGGIQLKQKHQLHLDGSRKSLQIQLQLELRNM